MIPRSSITRPAGLPRSTRADPPAICVAVPILTESAATIFAFSVSFPDGRPSFTLINDSEIISRATSAVDVNQIVLSEPLRPVEHSRVVVALAAWHHVLAAPLAAASNDSWQ